MIREAQAKDLSDILLLYAQLHDNLMPKDDEKLDAVWNSIVLDKNHHIIVAEVDGKIVSSCALVVIPNLTHGLRPYALVENVITDKACRNRGFATGCLDYAKQIALGADCYKIMLLTGSKNKDVLTFYKKAGYNSQDKTAFVQWL